MNGLLPLKVVGATDLDENRPVMSKVISNHRGTLAAAVREITEANIEEFNRNLTDSEDEEKKKERKKRGKPLLRKAQPAASDDEADEPRARGSVRPEEDSEISSVVSQDDEISNLLGGFSRR